MNSRQLLAKICEEGELPPHAEPVLRPTAPQHPPQPEPEAPEEEDLNDVIEKWMEVHHAYHLGERPEQFSQLLNDLSGGEYRDIDDFMADNPGAVDAVLNWIAYEVTGPVERMWAQNLRDAIGQEEESAAEEAADFPTGHHAPPE